MYSKEEIEKVIHSKIENDEELGEKSGGSGHLGYISYELKEYSAKELEDNLLEITYRYSTYVETEFTYYPDNPPYEYPCTKCIIINSELEIVEEKAVLEEPEEELEIYSSEDWKQVQEEIIKFTRGFLEKIEWEYGENRAPIKYPPQFYELISDESGLDYVCMIECDFEDEEKMYFKSSDPASLLEQIREELYRRFLPPE